MEETNLPWFIGLLTSFVRPYGFHALVTMVDDTILLVVHSITSGKYTLSMTSPQARDH